MNEFEKVALEFLGEKEKERIVRGLKETDDLSSEQCQNLRDAISNLSEEKKNELEQRIKTLEDDEQMNIAGGRGGSPIGKPPMRIGNPAIAKYGAPPPHYLNPIVPRPPHPFKRPGKPMNGENLETPKE